MVAADRTYLNEQAGRYLDEALRHLRNANGEGEQMQRYKRRYNEAMEACDLALLGYRHFRISIDEAARTACLDLSPDERKILLAREESVTRRSPYAEHHPDDDQGPQPARFELRRTEDETGVSGTGTVAWGVLFPDGTAVTRWCGTQTDVRQTCVWASLDHVQKVHGHAGKTLLVFHDPAPTIETPPPVDDEEPF